jgi:hypothetical protein
MCEIATVAHARPGIGAEILHSGKIWLEFMQQVERICQEAAENCEPKDGTGTACEEGEAP